MLSSSSRINWEDRRRLENSMSHGHNWRWTAMESLGRSPSIKEWPRQASSVRFIGNNFSLHNAAFLGYFVRLSPEHTALSIPSRKRRFGRRIGILRVQLHTDSGPSSCEFSLLLHKQTEFSGKRRERKFSKIHHYIKRWYKRKCSFSVHVKYWKSAAISSVIVIRQRDVKWSTLSVQKLTQVKSDGEVGRKSCGRHGRFRWKILWRKNVKNLRPETKDLCENVNLVFATARNCKKWGRKRKRFVAFNKLEHSSINKLPFCFVRSGHWRRPVQGFDGSGHDRVRNVKA